MVQFEGYNSTIKKVYDSGNSHLFDHWDTLSDSEKKQLLDELAAVDFDLMKQLSEKDDDTAAKGFEPAPFIPLPETDAEKEKFDKAHKTGVEIIKQGKVAAFIVAGGQGSRLGFEGPKGMFPVGPVSGKTLFQIFGEKILKYSRKYNTSIPWLVMTSQANHDDTVNYFKENNWFDLGKENIMIFPQNMIPSLDSSGRLILENKTTLFKNPDGHGGSLTALRTSGALDMLSERGIDIISYFQVDNPLIKIIDPVFIGFHALNDADISSKALEKAYPEEKIGVFVKFANGRVGVVEYSNLSDEQTNMKDEKGRLKFSAGSIAIHLFNRKFVEHITSGLNEELPFHIARKKIPAYTPEGIKEIDGIKYEKFVFDALPLTDKDIILETLREEEFAPVKNPSGVDSAESARGMMSSLHRKWLNERGIDIPHSAEVVEITPLAAVEPEDLDASIRLPDSEKILID